MTRFPTPPELVEQIIASGYDGYWSISADGKNGDKFTTVFLAPDTEQQIAKALELAPDGIEAGKCANEDGSEFASLHPWTIRYPAKKAQA